MEEGTAELNLGAAQVEGNISLQSVRGDVSAEGLTLKGALEVEKANLNQLNIKEARVEGNIELSKVNLEEVQAERMGDLSLTKVLLDLKEILLDLTEDLSLSTSGLNFMGAQVGGKFEAKNIEGGDIQASGMQIGKGLIWKEIEAKTVDLKGTRVGEELAIASLTCDEWESDEMIVVGKASIKGVRILGGLGGGFLGNEVR